MKVLRGKTPLEPNSALQTTDDNGQIASTIWAEESRQSLGTAHLCLSFGILTNKAIDEVDFPITLSYKRWWPGPRRAGGASWM